jgi:hypothetical protein
MLLDLITNHENIKNSKHIYQMLAALFYDLKVLMRNGELYHFTLSSFI